MVSSHEDTQVKSGNGDSISFEEDKRVLYSHPLFPLLALLFEKCELATQTQDFSCGDSFALDLQAFIQHQQQKCTKFFSGEPDIDNLMIWAIQVLRIHLLELEKVQDLCKDFCNRYISCLKTKLHSENLLRSEYSCDSDSSPSPNPCDQYGDKIDFMNESNSCPSVSPVSLCHEISDKCDRNTPAAPQLEIESPQSLTDSNLVNESSHESDSNLSKKKQKRGILPKHATMVMRSWLFQHIVHPYPTEEEKKHLAAQADLTLIQVNNWFINARRRILQPMLDTSDPNLKLKSNKSNPQPIANSSTELHNILISSDDDHTSDSQ